jgi:aldehyde reductase
MEQTCVNAKLMISYNFIALFGLGTWQSEKGTVASAVRNAIQLGYRLIDCAAVYKNQEEIGHVFEECFKEEAHFKREDFFIVSKLWNTCHSKDNVKQACKKTLHDLKLSYLDLYLIHFPIAFEYGGLDLDPIIPKDDKGNIKLARVSIAETWKAMEELVDEGLVKSIGISNFSILQTQELLCSARIVPAVNQIELHPYYTREALIKFCKIIKLKFKHTLH